MGGLASQDESEHRATSRFEEMSEIERYLVLVEGDSPSNYSAWSPDVPGCVATGETIETCVQEMRKALTGHLEVMREHGETIPAPTGPDVYVERAVAAYRPRRRRQSSCPRRAREPGGRPAPKTATEP
jgi:predicted RNase H-like HicB family nuclease